MRVSHFHGPDYSVQYAYYRFIPIWISINKWLVHAKTQNKIIGDSDTAEKFARRFTCIEDVKAYNKELGLKEGNYQPYKNKTIIG